MKKNIKTYVDIEEVIVDTEKRTTRKCYSVTFTEYYNNVYLGINFGKKEIKTKFPFLFKNLEIAKDFAQLKPEYKFVKFHNDNYNDRTTSYYTYIISAKDKTCYIKWEADSTDIEDHYNIKFEPIKHNPIVDTFVTKIKLLDWMHTYSLRNVTFFNERQKLSECLNCKSEETKKWHFELVESND